LRFISFLIRVILPYAIISIGILIKVLRVICWLNGVFLHVGVRCDLGLARFVRVRLLFSIAKI